MNGFQSPDIQAYYCYLVVLIVGTLVARTRVNTLLGRYPDRWAFGGTWALFAAYTTLPLALFWFLDYTAITHDTTLFAALAVAALYPQIFAGGVEGITMPGQTAALWKPFEAWTKVMDERIRRRNKVYNDRFEEQVRTKIAADAQTEAKLLNLTQERSQDLNALAQALVPLQQAMAANAPGAQRRLVDRLWKELRLAEPENYGYLIWQRGIIHWPTYWWWLARGKAKLVSGTALALILGFGVGAVTELILMRDQHPEMMIAYHRWRFEKGGGTDKDKFRSWRYLNHLLKRRPDMGKAIFPRLLEDLKFKQITAEQVKRTLSLVRDTHRPEVDEFSIEPLIEDLRGDNLDLRRDVQELLLDLQKEDYPDHPVSAALAAWAPKESDTPGEIESYIGQWRAWWDPLKSGPGKVKAVNPVAAAVIFEFGKAIIRPESEPALQQAADALTEHPDWKVRIEGYTDSVGAAAYNLRLSQRRAEAVQQALEQKHGIATGRLTAKDWAGRARKHRMTPRTAEPRTGGWNW
jgi:outer membrane protein OmpA-like peptidoglycan-associated protein